MFKSAVTVSLVPEAKGGPFVFWDDLAGSARSAKALGFDAIEVFPPGPEGVDPDELRSILDGEGLSLAAVGTGAGWVRHRLTLTDPDAARRRKAVDFVRSIIDLAGPLGAPAIIGSMQGRTSEGVDTSAALGYLAEALAVLGEHARGHGVPLLYEPLNRYETDLVHTVEAGLRLTEATPNVLLLADLFHMNIEEVDIPRAIEAGGRRIGHVHFVDSTRGPAGSGHLDFGPIVEALKRVGYAGYLSAEARPQPDPIGAARLTIETFRSLVSEGGTHALADD